MTSNVAWGDLDGDGDQDLVFGNYGQANQVYRNDTTELGWPVFTLIWESADAQNTQDVALGDFDLDGDLDLLVANQGQANQLFRNDGPSITTADRWTFKPPSSA